jgi:adenylate cyclase class IV
MRELELKAVVADADALRARLERAGASLTFEGRMDDRRYDTPERALEERDHILRVRRYDSTGPHGRARAHPSPVSLDWKGAASVENGYKLREELSVAADSADTLARMLGELGYEVTLAIDRDIAQFDLGGAMVRIERYPRMDTLVEVEGEPNAIEHAIRSLGIAREEFSADSVFKFAKRFEERTGMTACLSHAALAEDAALAEAAPTPERAVD